MLQKFVEFLGIFTPGNSFLSRIGIAVLGCFLKGGDFAYQILRFCNSSDIYICL